MEQLPMSIAAAIPHSKAAASPARELNFDSVMDASLV